jgi:lysozyme
MNIDQLQKELKRDEGCVNAIYLDHLNLPTCGIGHLITEWDEEYNQPVGTTISEDRVNELFKKDIEVTLEECKMLYENFDDLPEEAQLILANMMFNMGRPRLSKFKKMNKAIAEGDYLEASLQMEDSRWYKQVTNRAERLVQRMALLQKFPIG